MTTAFRNSLLIGALACLTTCGGGGGGGGDSTRPVIIGAAFVGPGPGPGPTAGDTLILFLSEDVALAAGADLDDLDLEVPGGTLGTVGTPPSLTGLRSVTIVLGAGVTFTPGVTTIVFRMENDSIMGLSGLLGNGGTPVVITTGDGNSPTIGSLTLNGIDGTLNGTGPAGGTLQTPRTGFTIDITATDPTSSIDPPEITANLTVTVSGIGRTPGEDFSGDLTLTQSGSSYSYFVPANVLFPNSTVTITVLVRDSTGMISTPVPFTFISRSISNTLRPFETDVNASQLWFLDFSRDEESYTVNLADPTTPIGVTQGANGTPDLDDLHLVMGLHSATPIANVLGSLDSNEVVTQQLQAAITSDLGTLYGGANISITFTSPGAFPGTSVAYSSFGFSQICIAGAEDVAGATAVLGIAIFDLNNSTQNNDCLIGFQGSQRLGVFMHTVVNDGIKPPGTTLYRLTYDPLTPSRGGTPIGDDPSDGMRLLGTLVDGRTTTIANAILRWARMISVVTAHETGHSMGLVAGGAMPNGLHGNDAVNFPLPAGVSAGAEMGHIHNAFPAGSLNVMTPAISFTAAQSASTGFNTLNLAYLLETVLYN